MPAIELNGRETADKNEKWLKAQVSRLAQLTGGQAPCLATILVGEHQPSKVYIKIKQDACTRMGINFIPRTLPAEISTDELIKEIRLLNQNAGCHGILLQHPVPRHIDELRCFDAIDPDKDVDGVTSVGYARLSRGLPAYECATPKGIARLLRAYQLSVDGLDAVVVGRGPILGAPMAAILTRANATVTIAHSRTQNLEAHVRRAQLLVAGVGRAGFIPGNWLADEVIAVDAGYNPGGVGDIDLDAQTRWRCRAYTPVPGGVGPMTVNTLLNQTFVSAHRALLNKDPEQEPY